MASRYKLELGQVIANRRRELGLTQKELADLTHYKESQTVSRWERGENLPGDLEIVAGALQWTLPEMMAGLRPPDERAARKAGLETPEPFSGPTVADLDRRLASIENKVDQLLDRKPAVAAIDEHTAEEAVDYLKRATQVMQDTLGRLGRDVGRQDLTASPAADRAQKRSPAAA